MILKDWFPNNNHFVIQRESTNWYPNQKLENDEASLEYLMERFPEADPAIFTNYLSKNDEPIIFDTDGFTEAGIDVSIVDPEDFRDPERGWFSWDLFFETFPESPGLTIFTRVGANRNGTEAIVEFEHLNIHGGGRLIYLRKDDNQQWQIIEILERWIS